MLFLDVVSRTVFFLMNVSFIYSFHIRNQIRRPNSHLFEMASGLKGSALVIQNNGGGHGEIGYVLCKVLVESNPELDVVLLQDTCDKTSSPFSSYADLENIGVKIIFSQLSKGSSDSDETCQLPSAILEKKFDYIIDNFSKGADVESFISLATKSSSKQYIFVSSAGIYKSSKLMPLMESDAVKSSGVREVELSLEASGVPFTLLRPQYMYGPRASKRYIDYFLGRAYRKLPIPLPFHGDQLVSLTHVDDVASMIACALGHAGAIGETFNCVSGRVVGYRALAELCHNALGHPPSDANFLFYDPEQFDRWTSSSPVKRFPFRPETFVASSSKAMRLLGWQPRHDLIADVKEAAAAYASTGGAQPWGMDELRCDLEIIASKDHRFMFTYPFFDDDIINMETRPYSFESSSAFAEPGN